MLEVEYDWIVSFAGDGKTSEVKAFYEDGDDVYIAVTKAEVGDSQVVGSYSYTERALGTTSIHLYKANRLTGDYVEILLEEGDHYDADIHYSADINFKNGQFNIINGIFSMTYSLDGQLLDEYRAWGMPEKNDEYDIYGHVFLYRNAGILYDEKGNTVIKDGLPVTVVEPVIEFYSEDNDLVHSIDFNKSQTVFGGLNISIFKYGEGVIIRDNLQNHDITAYNKKGEVLWNVSKYIEGGEAPIRQVINIDDNIVVLLSNEYALFIDSTGRVMNRISLSTDQYSIISDKYENEILEFDGVNLISEGNYIDVNGVTHNGFIVFDKTGEFVRFADIDGERPDMSSFRYDNRFIQNESIYEVYKYQVPYSEVGVNSFYQSKVVRMDLIPYIDPNTENEYYEEALRLKELGVFQGSDKGLELDRAPTRIEGSVMFVRLLGGEDEALKGEFNHPFTDVPEWADGYVGWLYEEGLTQGIGNNKFGSNDIMSLQGYSTFMLRSLGYSDAEGDFSWKNAIEFAETYKVLNSSVTDDDDFTRGHLAKVSIDTLGAVLKDSNVTLEEALK